MTIARARLAIASNGLGIAQQLDLPPAFVGCCSSGTVDTPTLITNPQAILDTFGRGPLCEAAATLQECWASVVMSEILRFSVKKR